MASLQGTTVTTLTASTSISASNNICSYAYSTQQWAGTPSLAINASMDLIGNTGGYSWIMGYMDVGAHQSYNSSHQFWFALSRYGIKTKTAATWDNCFALSYYQDPGNPDINYLRCTNTYNQPAGYHINARIFAGKNSNFIISSYLYRLN
jgi:hypothetical protein